MAQQQMTPEQSQELQERLSRMSPEELRQYQKQNCIFCHIASGKQEAKKIYEDINCIGVLDINPANAGHILLLPKEHYAVLPLVPEDILGHLAMVAKAISNIMLKALESKGTTLFIANGAAAGQKAQHVMMHIIPRDEKDGLNISIPKYRINESQLKQIKERLATRIKELLNYSEKEPKTLEEKKEEKEQTIPAMADIKREGLLVNRKEEPKEIEFEEKKEIEFEESKEIEFEEKKEIEEKSNLDDDKKISQKKPVRKRKKIKDNEDEIEEDEKEDDEDDGKRESKEDTANKPKSGVDLDVIAKLFG